MSKKAIVIGGTGATGRQLIRQLLKSDKWEQITSIGRKPVLDGEKYDKLLDIKKINPSYFLIYKWITYDQSITHIDDTNHNFVSEVQKNCKPIYIVNLHGKDLCWIYQYPLIEK